LKKQSKTFPFTKTYTDITKILTNHKLASLGDTYINFTYSLALSNKKGEPTSAKVKGSTLAKALKKAGLREHMPARMSRHKLADAAEALTVYAWLQNYITLEESVKILEKTDDSVEGFNQLLTKIKNRIKFS